MDIFEEIQMQIAQLNMWTKAYDEGNPMVSDAVWDEHYFRLAELERNTGMYFDNSPTQKISYQLVSKLNKVKHNHPMLSLDKTKDWDEFINYFSDINTSKDVIGMLKLDGLTCSLRYVDGKLVSAETRGNGEEGEDILHNALVVPSIPNKIKYKDELIIDGEIICTYKDFEKFSTDYKNPRNFAAGSIRLLDSKECATRNLTFVAWYVVKGLSDSLLDNFIDLQKLGFTVTPYTSSFDWDAKEFLQERATEFGYPIDGLVGRFESRKFGESLGATGHHSRAAFAFKFYDEEYEAELVNIEYEPSRNGQLTPVAIFEPIEIDGTECSKSSLHNLSVMESLSGGFERKGDTLYIFKANSIIPQVSKWIHNGEYSEDRHISIPKTCPVCGGETEIRISDSGVKTLWCANPSCDGKLINKLEYIFGKKGLDVKGLSKATFEKLIDWGMIEKPRDVFILVSHKSDWINKPGFGVKSVEKILDVIEDKRKGIALEKIICAAGIPLIGERVSKVLAEKFKTWNDFRAAVNNGFDFSTFGGFGYEMSKAIQQHDYTEIDYIVENYLTITEPEQAVTVENSSLQGKVIVITGKLVRFKNRAALKAEIEKFGGKVTDSVSKKTDILINNDTKNNSAKSKAAIAANIPILTEDEFVSKFLTI